MQELNLEQIKAISGGITASELLNDLYLAAGAVSMVTGATWYVPSISAALRVTEGAFWVPEL